MEPSWHQIKVTSAGKPKRNIDHETLKRLGLTLKRAEAESPPREWLTVAEVAADLQLSERTIRRAYSRGALRASKVGNTVRIRRDALEDWLEAGAIEARETPEPEL